MDIELKLKDMEHVIHDLNIQAKALLQNDADCTYSKTQKLAEKILETIKKEQGLAYIEAHAALVIAYKVLEYESKFVQIPER